LSVSIAVVFTLGGCATGQSQETGTKEQDAEFHYKMGAGYFESHKIPKALKALHKAIEMNPKLQRAHHILGLIYMGRKEYRKAEKHLKKAVQLDEKFFSAKNNLGTVYLAQKRWKEALDVFKGLIDQDLYGTPHLAHNNVGWAYYNLGEYRRAKKHIEKAIFLKPEMCLAYNNLGQTLEKLKQTRKARRKYRQAIRKCPGNYAEPHYHLGKLLDRLDKSGAAQHFKKCIQLAPQSDMGQRCRQYVVY
jgi:Tfp pilus assembly protein PilF